MALQGTSDSMDVQHRLDVLEPWISTNAPSVNNDGNDTANVGKRFFVGSVWIKTSATAKAYFCTDNTSGAAVWVSW